MIVRLMTIKQALYGRQPIFTFTFFFLCFFGFVLFIFFKENAR